MLKNTHPKPVQISSDTTISEISVDDLEVNTSDDDDDKDDNNRSDFPRVVVFHDSVLNGVDPARLSKSYGLDVTKTKTPTINDCRDKCKQLKSKPEAIVLHVGINDLKSKKPDKTSSDLIAIAKMLQEKESQAEIVISKICPAKNEEMKAKIELHNALVYAALYNENRVSFVDSPVRNHLLEDGIHVNQRGSSVLASTIGRHVESLLWKKQSRRRHDNYGKEENNSSRRQDEMNRSANFKNFSRLGDQKAYHPRDQNEYHLLSAKKFQPVCWPERVPTKKIQLQPWIQQQAWIQCC
jgi:hypothetical protein